MKFIRKFGPWIVCMMLAVAMLAIALVGMKSINSYKSVIAEQEASIESMSTFIDNDIGTMIDCYVVNQSVRVGDEITEDMLSPVTIPEKIAYTDKEVEVETTDEDGKTVKTTELQKVLNIITSPNEIVGKQFKRDLSTNSIISPDDVTDSTMDKSTREFELIVDDFPTTIQIGDYVDIRIKFTYGEDFIALPHKRIEGMNLETGLFRFEFNESEINMYNSMLLDKAMYDSVEIYMLKYVDASSQAAAEGFYPINDNVSEIISANPNILSLVQEEMKLERQQLNSIMGGGLDSFDSKDLNKISNQIENFQDDLVGEKSVSIKDRIKAEEKAAKEAAKAQG